MLRNNIQFLNNTLKICQKGYYIFNEQQISLPYSLDEMRQIRIFLPDELESMKKEVKPRISSDHGLCLYSCENTDSLSMAIKRDSLSSTEDATLVLNFANGIYPGGGARMGASAQEEDLCRRSSLLLSLENEQAKGYYSYNKNLHSALGSDALMLTPHVTVLKDENGQILDKPCNIAVLSCAAPDISNGLQEKSQTEYEEILGDRILKILITAYQLQYRNLVLGAFGCGVFGNDAAVVAKLFYRNLKKLDASGIRFSHVDFAILCKKDKDYNYEQFSRYFTNQNFYSISIKDNKVLFWHEDEINGCFSNGYFSPFVIDDFCYQSVEQYMMSRKAKLFHDYQHYTSILRADSALQCRQWGKEVTPYDDTRWSLIRKDILLKALTAKFEQNPDLKKMLMNTGDALIAQANPLEAIYGIGISAEQASVVPQEEWKGENLLGRLLMEIRDHFMQSSQ